MVEKLYLDVRVLFAVGVQHAEQYAVQSRFACADAHTAALQLALSTQLLLALLYQLHRCGDFFIQPLALGGQ